jgi:hypothetical protein
MVFVPLDPDLVTGLTEKRLQRCLSVAAVRRGHITSVLHPASVRLLAGSQLLDEFENAVRVYSNLISKIESEFARRAIEEALNGSR